MDSPNNLTGSTTVVASERAISTTLDGEEVILDRDDGEYYGLNEVGTFVWELLEQPQSIDDLCDDVTARYDVEYERCRNDIEELAIELADKNLVRLDDT